MNVSPLPCNFTGLDCETEVGEVDKERGGTDRVGVFGKGHIVAVLGDMALF